MNWLEETLKDPEARRAYEKAKRREARKDRLYALRHRILPFWHVWYGPVMTTDDDDLVGTVCGICSKPGPNM